MYFLCRDNLEKHFKSIFSANYTFGGMYNSSEDKHNELSLFWRYETKLMIPSIWGQVGNKDNNFTVDSQKILLIKKECSLSYHIKTQ